MQLSRQAGATPFMDRLGTLCHEGLDTATYLYQVPDDESQRDKLRQIVEAIGEDPVVKGRREFPRIVDALRESLAGPGTQASAEVLSDGFERMVKLWQTTRSGLY